MLALAEHDRDLGDLEPGARRVERQLDLERVAAAVDEVAVERPQRARAEALEAAGEVA